LEADVMRLPAASWLRCQHAVITVVL